MTRHKILFLAADPVGLPRRRIAERAREIEGEIQLGRHRDRFEFVPRLAARPLDLLRELRTMKPSIVHFCGHPGISGIYFENDNRQPVRITETALHETFGAAGQSVQIVVVDGHATSSLGQAVCKFVPICVGASAASDDAARAFSVGFYGAVASNEPVVRASLQGRAAMSLRGTETQDRPEIYGRSDINLETFILSDHVASVAYLAAFGASSIQRHIAQHSQVLKVDPSDRDALRAMATSYLMLGQFELADRFARQLIEQHPADPFGYARRAISVFKGQRPKTAVGPVVREAEQLLDTAGQLDPENGDFDVLLAGVRNDYYALNGLRVPPPAPHELIARAATKRVDRREIEQAYRLLKLDSRPLKQLFGS